MAMNNSLAEVHPELVSEWSEKNMPLKPDEVNAKSRKQDLDCQQLVSGITGEEKISDADLFTYRVCLTPVSYTHLTLPTICSV